MEAKKKRFLNDANPGMGTVLVAWAAVGALTYGIYLVLEVLDPKRTPPQPISAPDATQVIRAPHWINDNNDALTNNNP